MSLDRASQAALWTVKNVRPLIASLASKSLMDAAEAMQILEGIDGLLTPIRQAQELEARGWNHERLLALVAFVEQHGEAIKRAAGG